MWRNPHLGLSKNGVHPQICIWLQCTPLDLHELLHRFWRRRMPCVAQLKKKLKAVGELKEIWVTYDYGNCYFCILNGYLWCITGEKLNTIWRIICKRAIKNTSVNGWTGPAWLIGNYELTHAVWQRATVWIRRFRLSFSTVARFLETRIQL